MHYIENNTCILLSVFCKQTRKTPKCEIEKAKALLKDYINRRDLSKVSGIKQPAIARIEKFSGSPRIATMMKLLYSMGYTLKVVPLGETEKKILDQ